MATSTLTPPADPGAAGRSSFPTSGAHPLAPVDAEPGLRPWVTRASLVALLVATGFLYVWDLGASGYANSFYSAAAQAGSQSWKAFFYGSLDAGNAITVDKPPASLWLMALSVRLFGLSSWSILVPQALLGVATVGVVYASVRRTAGHWAGILAGALLALTPAATLMFRFNNPDALLVLLLALATYATLRATERASGKWLVGAGVLVGFGFLTKMLQAFLVLPAFALVYLVAGPTTLKKRVLHLLAATAAMVVALGWWVAIVELVPESWRPYIGGSQNNSVLELVFGYNGLGRITGNETGSVTGGGGGAGSWGETGLTRLFDGVSGGMIAWLIPAALLLAAFALVALGRRPRTDPPRAAILVWAASLVTTGVVFSLMAGIYHDYYTVALAPAIAATVALSATELWRRRTGWLARTGLAVAMAVSTVWAVVLLGRASGQPYASLTWVVGITGAAAAVGLLFSHVLPKAVAALVVTLALVGGVTGPAAYSLQTATTAHSGSIVTAGPVSGGMGGGGMGGGAMGGGRPAGQRPQGGGTQPGTTQPGTQPGGAQPDGTRQGGGAQGGAGGLMGGATVSADMQALLTDGASSYTWVAAATGAQNAASYQLATGSAVMAIGGFNGSDPSPTLAEFQALVAQQAIHYYIVGGQGGQQNGGSSASSEIASWVQATFTAQTVGSTTVYDLTSGS